MADSIKLIECPRDAWQGMPGQIPSATKVEYLKALIAAGFKHIDAVSFVSPKAVPQMADSETVLQRTRSARRRRDHRHRGQRARRGARHRHRRRADRRLPLLAFADLSEEQPEPDAGREPRHPREGKAEGRRRRTRTPLPTSPWPSAIPTAICGMPKNCSRASACLPTWTCRRFHWPTLLVWRRRNRSPTWLVRCCRDSTVSRSACTCTAVPTRLQTKSSQPTTLAAAASTPRSAGLGGCPFAQDVLVGNLPTEIVLEALREHGASLPPIKPLAELVAMSAKLADRFGGPKM